MLVMSELIIAPSYESPNLQPFEVEVERGYMMSGEPGLKEEEMQLLIINLKKRNDEKTDLLNLGVYVC